MEQYEELFEQGISVVNIPLNLSVKELERMLNKQLDTVLYEDNDINDGDNMMMKAEKKEDISLRLDSSSVAYRVPLDIWVRYNTGVGKVEGTGAIAISLKTGYSIQSDWKLKTNTEFTEYEWLEKPRLKMGLVSLPVGFVADMLIDNFKSTITENIDQQISENLGLDSLIADGWKKMHEPLEVSEDYHAWLMMNPQKISMTPIKSNDDDLQATVLIESKPTISFGEKPKDPELHPLPPFAYAQSGGEEFMIRIGTEISYDEAERIVKETVQGERFDYGNRYVVVDDIELYGQGNKLVVNTKISGTYSGDIFMTGRPEFNARSNSIDIKDLKYTVDTRNFLLRSAGWLLRSKFKNMIQSNLDFLLQTNLKEIEDQIKKQLDNYELTENFVLNGDLSGINIANAYLAPEGMRVDVALKGNVKVRMTHLETKD
ncbi:MAG: DUF4403 family protein [Saprospiraceae bacterium]|nr:DUF4403 family protein [Lewinella sp.]